MYLKFILMAWFGFASLSTHAASATGEAFSKQIMLGVKVTTQRQSDVAEKERTCVNALPDTMLADAFDGAFDSLLSQAERRAANEHYNSILAKRYFDVFAEQMRQQHISGVDMEKQYRSRHNPAEINYMKAFDQSDLGKKVGSVLQSPHRMQSIKAVVFARLMECRQPE